MTSFKHRNQLLSNPAGMLLFVHLRVQGRGDVAYLVNDVVDHTVTRGTETITYIGLPFSFDPPKDTPGGSTKATLNIANAGRGMSEVMETLDPMARVSARVLLTDEAEPTAIEKEWRLPFTSVTLNQDEAVAVIGTDFLMSQSSCTKRYTPNEAPGIF